MQRRAAAARGTRRGAARCFAKWPREPRRCMHAAPVLSCTCIVCARSGGVPLDEQGRRVHTPGDDDIRIETERHPRGRTRFCTHVPCMRNDRTLLWRRSPCRRRPPCGCCSPLLLPQLSLLLLSHARRRGGGVVMHFMGNILSLLLFTSPVSQADHCPRKSIASPVDYASPLARSRTSRGCCCHNYYFWRPLAHLTSSRNTSLGQ
jgi:hypothetical protein